MLEFLHILNRGGLKYHATSVVSFIVACHAYFENIETSTRCCRNYVTNFFEMVDDMFDCQIDSAKVYRCLANIFCNNFCKGQNSDQIESSKRKIMKLSGKTELQ